MKGTLIAQLYNAEPKATVPFAASTRHPALYFSSFMPLISLFTWSISLPSLFCISWRSTCNSLMSLSTLLIKSTGLTCSLRAWRSTVSVCGIVPSTASITITAPSTALIALVTSPPKSTCPGVSIRLIRYSLSWYSCTIETHALSIVIPLSCSSSSESVNNCLPASSFEIMPAPARILSVKVVLPWSIWATIPIFRIISGSFMSTVTRSTIFFLRPMLYPHYLAAFATRSFPSFLLIE